MMLKLRSRVHIVSVTPAEVQQLTTDEDVSDDTVADVAARTTSVGDNAHVNAGSESVSLTSSVSTDCHSLTCNNATLCVVQVTGHFTNCRCALLYPSIAELSAE